ncbi:hypothetical protein RchiOBHm_Chr4g0396191 [Rosa chinensis]|uniref:Transmembrane protein n=1 Tax=Rosa chinensis TaxID=74649 RepID=A0A2P6QRP0_ROSCH|nr:uncharacterized protein LOC112196487 [Rosa chinensis]PRQ36856.1 hypothetical protein RchiOBHm_Chr4g0396191 [Rosa chinensis]
MASASASASVVALALRVFKGMTAYMEEVQRCLGFNSTACINFVMTVVIAASFFDTVIVGELILIEIRGGVVVVLSFGLVLSYTKRMKRNGRKFVRFVRRCSLAEIGKGLVRWLVWAWHAYFFLIHLLKFLLAMARLGARICGAQPPGTEAIHDVSEAWTTLVT